MGSNVWLIYWAREDATTQKQTVGAYTRTHKHTHTHTHTHSYIQINVWIYFGLVLGCIISSILRAVFAFHVSLVAGRNLHNDMLQGVCVCV